MPWGSARPRRGSCRPTIWSIARQGETEGGQTKGRRVVPRTRSGDVLLDDGSVLDFPARAFDASGLRLLRLGQRVRLDVDNDGTVTFLTIATLADPHAYDT